MTALSTTMALVMIAQGIAGLQWSPTSPQNNAVVYACATGTLSLPWSVTVASGDTIVDISWFVSGTSKETIAAVTHGNFFAMPAFAKRTRQLANAGVELDRAGVSETGNYSVEVVGRSAAGVLTTLRRSVTVHVAVGLQTTDGQLHISQQQEAEYDVTTDQYHVVLRCGTFIYPSHPPFEVTWETPSGQRNSSRYDNGTFYLRLIGPMPGGTYTCRLPPVSSCGHGNGNAVAVSASVDKTEARLLLMEARQTALDTRSTALELANTDLVRQNNVLRAALQGLQGELHSNTSALENRVHFLGKRLRATEGLLKQTVSFLAGLSWLATVDVAAGSTLVLSGVFRNHGDGYDGNTGNFTAPYNGTYCFLATAAKDDPDADSRVNLDLYVNGVNVADMETKAGLSLQPASLHAVVALKAGETAYLYNVDHVHYYGAATSFGGFLVDHTPN